MIIEGGDFNRSFSKILHKIFTNIAQLICFNSVKRKRSEKIQNLHHSTKNEPPLPVLVGLKVHTKTGKSIFVDSLADEGMSITYNRVLEIRRIFSNQVCVEYQERGTVCSSQLQDHVFTTAIIDNLDHNLISATAQNSFHGTAISIFQHYAVPISFPPFQLNTTKADRCTKLSLPEFFTKIRPTLEVKPEPPQHASLTVSGNQTKSVPN